VRFGVVAVAAGYLAANLLHAAPCLLLALRELNLPAAALLRGLRAPAVGAVVLVAVLAGAQALPIAQAWPAALRLAVFSVLGGTVYLATVWTTGRQTCRDALLLLGWRH
jgi:PST family polysaccharide transporter